MRKNLHQIQKGMIVGRVLKSTRLFYAVKEKMCVISPCLILFCKIFKKQLTNLAGSCIIYLVAALDTFKRCGVASSGA